MNSHTDLIKEKINILDLVSQYVRLEKSGSTYKGKSPFTNEKTPSFFVHPDKGFFYCFSSGKGGDIFSFIQEVERMEFREALVFLAERAGVSLDDVPKGNDQKKRLYDLLDQATKFYEITLRKNKDAVQYLLDRGLTKDTLIKFRIGFALDSWDDLYIYLKSKKFSDQEIESAGMIVPRKTGSGFYNRFRSRIMFPIFDPRGRVIGFSGRVFGDEEGVAKYMNSPEGPLFDKSSVLYGYHSAKQKISKENICILVEGQFDVLLAQQSGFENTVAISGTGLTEGHIKLIQRFADSVLLALDADKAGVKATRRSVLLAYKYGLDVGVITLPEGKDPADAIVENPYVWEVAVSDAKSYFDYRIEIFLRGNPSLKEKQKLVQDELFLFTSFIPSAIEQDFLLQKIALFLGASLDAVRRDFSKFIPDKEYVNQSSVDSSQKNKSLKPKANSHLELLHLLYYAQEKSLLDSEDYQKFEDLYGKKFDQAIASQSTESLNLAYFLQEQKLAELDNAGIIKNVKALFSQTERAFLLKEREKITKNIQLAALKKDNKKMSELLLQKNILDKKIDTL